MLKQFGIILPTIAKEWKQQSTTTGHIYKLVEDMVRGAALAWIIYQSGNFGTLAYTAIGIAFISLLMGTLARSGWALSNEIQGKTLDFTFISLASLPVILFSKILAQIIYELPGSVVSIAIVFFIARHVPEIVDPGLLPFSLLLVVTGLAVISLCLGALVVLVGGKAGFFLGVVPLSAVFSGFILPVDRLPFGLGIIAHILPTSWAMDSVWLSVNGASSIWSIISVWGISILVIVVWFAIAWYLCKIVGNRVRVSGALSSS
jgi:ABC-type multidrug transport system permease subunit